MSKEEYVKSGTAKLLKEKGFNWPTIEYYSSSGSIYRFPDGIADICGILSYQRPTQQMACRWLREVHNIFIGVDLGTDMDDVFGYMPFVHILDNLSCSDVRYVPFVDADDICDFTPKTYEDAVEEALKYVLTNLI